MTKIKTVKQIKLAIIFIVLLIGVIIIYNIFKKMPYESHYFEKLGVNRIRYLYSDMIKDFGEPLEIRQVKEFERVDAIYEEFIMSFPTKTDNSFLLGVDIIGPKYRFGWRSIGVGSTKKEVVKAYVNVLPSPDTDYAYVDGGIFIQFFFNSHGIVEKIQFFDYNHF